MKIVLPDHIDLLAADLAKLQSFGQVTIYEDTIGDESTILTRIQGADLIVPAWIHITERIIRNSPSLKYIVMPAVGYDDVDLQAATAAGIKVCNCPTHNASAVAEYTIALMFAVTRRLIEANAALKSGKWNTEHFKSVELAGKQLGLIGYGGIGQQVAKRALALGMTVNHATSRTSAEELDHLIAQSDILSLHLPLNPRTRHLIDERRLNLMQPSAYLINTARGAIVDQQALLSVLQQHRIAGAALDVFEDEPVGGVPNAQIQELLKLDNVVATPHIAYNTHEMVQKLGQELLQTIEACLNGNPIHVVN